MTYSHVPVLLQWRWMGAVESCECVGGNCYLFSHHQWYVLCLFYCLCAYVSVLYVSHRPSSIVIVALHLDCVHLRIKPLSQLEVWSVELGPTDWSTSHAC